MEGKLAVQSKEHEQEIQNIQCENLAGSPPNIKEDARKITNNLDYRQIDCQIPQARDIAWQRVRAILELR